MVVKASRRLQEQICPQHGKLLEVYCRTDQQCICMLCTMDDHEGHEILSAAAERAERQKQLLLTKNQFQKIIQERQKEIWELKKAVESHKTSTQAAVEYSERIFTELISSIERKHSEVTELIRAQEKAAVGRAEKLLKRLEREIAELKRRDAELEELTHTDDHIQFLQSLQSLSNTSKSTGSTGIQFSVRSFEEVARSVSQLTEKLEMLYEEEFEKIASGGDFSSMQNSKTAQHTHKYSCELTLDLNTANRHLRLSEGGTVVTCSNADQSYPDHPGRFDYWPQALCKEALSGRCYWEVEWRGGDGVFMAVSYEGIGRKGRAAESVFGCNSQSWRLTCSPSGCSFWHNNKDCKTRRAPSSCRIGVYLDHSAGTLSFYSVSVTMTLLQKVQTAFSQPVHAGFLVHPGSTIKLSHFKI